MIEHRCLFWNICVVSVGITMTRTIWSTLFCISTIPWPRPSSHPSAKAWNLYLRQYGILYNAFPVTKPILLSQPKMVEVVCTVNNIIACRNVGYSKHITWTLCLRPYHPPGKHRFPFQRSWAGLSLVSAWMGDRLVTPDFVSFSPLLFLWF